MDWLTPLGPTAAVVVGYALTAYQNRKQTKKLDAVHTLVDGQHSALVDLVAAKDAKIETLHEKIENGT